LAQTLSYGARIIQVRGTYSDCAKLAVEMSEKHGFYLAGDYAFRLEGQKSQAYEIAEQLGWKAPDYLVCPVGCGTNLSAIWKGFKELKKLDLIDSLPKLIAVQPHGCNVVVQAQNSKSKKLIVLEKPDTICSAVAAGNPLDGKKVLQGLKESKGKAVEVSDGETLEVEQMMAKEEAIFVEPSGALSMAAVQKLQEKKFFKPTDVVVCVATGNGLKDPKSATKIVPDPPTIDPEMSEVDNYLKHKLYHIQSEGIKNKQKVLWDKIPTIAQIKKIINTEFGVELTKEVLEQVLDSVRAYETKGKAVAKQDLQNIIEEHLDEYHHKNKYLEIIDFETKTSKYNKAQASVKLRYGDKVLLGQAEGVGTVDAIIKALKKGFKEHDKLFIKLTDYHVEIFTGGVDASVKVVMTAIDKNGNRIIAQATSPDVIVASVTAFEKCYNFLYYKNHK
ncbi:pyridoxal-phosphate dependent enzyme, partial [Candidatus Peregrinibacteria bacterium]|nr:pyridoxal-phosphate dependent enzyme [Candidatus Peregrinibacteria bacterium]